MLASNRDTRNEERRNIRLTLGGPVAVKLPGHEVAEGDAQAVGRGRDAVALDRCPSRQQGKSIGPSPSGRLRFLPELSSGKILRTAVGDGSAQMCGQQLTMGRAHQDGG